MTTTQTPGPAGSAIAMQLTGSGTNDGNGPGPKPGGPSHPKPTGPPRPTRLRPSRPGERATPAPAAAAPVTAGESRVGRDSSALPGGDSLHDPQRPRPKPMPLPPRGFDLPLRASTPRFERTCPCLMCKPFVSG